MQLRQLSTGVLQMNPPFCKTNHSFLYISLPSLHDYSLPADVRWGSFVTHSFNPNGRLRGGYARLQTT